jgi:hypothetical protein
MNSPIGRKPPFRFLGVIGLIAGSVWRFLTIIAVLA